jgi:hypothetical protein
LTLFLSDVVSSAEVCFSVRENECADATLTDRGMSWAGILQAQQDVSGAQSGSHNDRLTLARLGQ